VPNQKYGRLRKGNKGEGGRRGRLWTTSGSLRRKKRLTPGDSRKGAFAVQTTASEALKKRERISGKRGGFNIPGGKEECEKNSFKGQKKRTSWDLPERGRADCTVKKPMGPRASEEKKGKKDESKSKVIGGGGLSTCKTVLRDRRTARTIETKNRGFVEDQKGGKRGPGKEITRDQP